MEGEEPVVAVRPSSSDGGGDGGDGVEGTASSPASSVPVESSLVQCAAKAAAVVAAVDWDACASLGGVLGVAAAVGLPGTFAAKKAAAVSALEWLQLEQPQDLLQRRNLGSALQG